MSIICAFFGHRNIPENLEPHLHELVERAITEYGATEFWDGYYGGFDELAADVVISLKTKYPHIRLKRIFAYSPTSSVPRRGFDTNVYPEMLDQVSRQLAYSPSQPLDGRAVQSRHHLYRAREQPDS